MIDKELLKSVISEVQSQGTTGTAYINKRNKLVYGTSDETELNKMDNETKEEKEEQFRDTLTILGYPEEEYIYLQLAYDAYATYRLTAGLEIGGKTYDISDSTLEKEIKDSTSDVYAIAIKFYSESDATTFVENYVNKDSKLANVSSAIRYYTGDNLYRTAEDATITYEAGEGYKFTIMTITLEDDTEVQVPNADILKDSDGNFIYDEENHAFVSARSTKLQDADGNVMKDADEKDVYSKYVLIKLNATNDGWVSYTKYTNKFDTVVDPDSGEETTDYEHWTKDEADTDEEINETEDTTIVKYEDATFTLKRL